MKKGKSMKAAARSWKKPRRSSAKRTVRRVTRRVKSGGKRTVARRGNGLNMQSIGKWIRLAALVGPAAVTAMGAGTIESKGKQIIGDYTGMTETGAFDWNRALNTYKPVLAASLFTYGIPKLVSIIRSIKL
jgi:hypothetical protein